MEMRGRPWRLTRRPCPWMRPRPCRLAPQTRRPVGLLDGELPPPADTPTQLGPHSIRFDISHGARVVLPERADSMWENRLRDLDTGNIPFPSDNKGAFVRSSKRFFVRFGMEVWDIDEAGTVTPVFSHEYDVRGREVLIHLPVGTLSNNMGWLSYGCYVPCSGPAPAKSRKL